MNALEVSPFAPTVFGAMNRRRGLVLACVVVLGTAGAVYGASSSGTATAKASIVIDSTGSTGQTPAGGSLATADQAAIMKLPSNLDAAARLVDQKYPAAGVTGAQLSGKVTVTQDTSSDLITVSFAGDDPKVAAEAADDVILAYVNTIIADNNAEYRERLTNLTNQIAKLNAAPDIQDTASQDYQLRSQYLQQFALLAPPASGPGAVGTYSPAETPALSGSGGAILFALLGVIVGLVGGGGAAYLMVGHRPRIENRLEPELLLERPFLAEIPDFSLDRLPSDLPAFDGERSAAAEGFRFAADALEPGRTYAVVSAVSGDGKSVTVANIAVTAARAGRRVLAIDGSTDGQGLSWLLGVPADRPGLAEVMRGEVDPAAAISRIEQVPGNLHVLPPGFAGDAALSAIDPATTRDVLREVRRRFDLVVIDAPAVLERAAGAVLARQADAVVVVVPYAADVRVTEEFAKRLSLLGLPVLGYFFTRSPHRPAGTWRATTAPAARAAAPPYRAASASGATAPTGRLVSSPQAR
jgi:Mrp family chromosome partitioning ATPase